MAEKKEQTNGYTRGDEEMSNSESQARLKRNKRIKIAIYIAIFAVFQTIVITVFALVVMRAKSPKVRLTKDFDIQKLETVSSSPPSFDMIFTMPVRVKNPNWGPYKFQNSTATFSYDGATVGEAFIPKGKAGFMGTEVVNVVVNLDSKQLASTAGLGTELSEGSLKLTATARIDGKVKLMFIMKKNKSSNMNCTIVFDVVAKNLKTLECK